MGGMKALDSWNADELLAISVDEPEQLFSGNINSIRSELRLLSSLWHPDRNSDRRANWVFAHVHDLFDVAIKKLEKGVWVADGELNLWTQDKKHFRLRFKRRHQFELGELFVGDEYITYLINREYKDLTDNGCLRMDSLRFADARMKDEMSRFLPEVAHRIETCELSAVVIRKPTDFVLLRDVLDHFGGQLDPKHVAWIISALLNLMCYLEWAKLNHNGLSVDTCLIAPQLHETALVGGWWYSATQFAQLSALPELSIEVAPPDILHRRLSDFRIDLELVRHLGLHLLGTRVGARATYSDIPEPLLDWLSVPSAGSALRDYESWQRVLWESFGERRFTVMPITAQEIYGT